ncbi:MAG: hypothetical protein EKE20_14440 [Candidatus Symbiopectobacterium sp. Dall1.0]|nr:hypothetical protein [Candidatus Symbiopectobacterium sp. Dall1.0]
MKKKFCLTTSRQSNAMCYQKESAWFRHCEVEQIPYIQLRRRTKRTDIHWDYITYPFSLDDAFSGEHGAWLCAEVSEPASEYQRINNKESFALQMCL